MLSVKADFDSLKQLIKDATETLRSAKGTILSLVQQRDDATSAAHPEDVDKVRENNRVFVQNQEMQVALEQVRKDTEEAIAAAQAQPKTASPKTPPSVVTVTPIAPAAAK